MSARSPDVDIITFGCRLNAYESEVIRARAAEDGLTDAVVFNTCAVTGEAVRQARQAIRKARRERPGAKLIVTGCAAQIDPDSFAAMDEVLTRRFTAYLADRRKPVSERGRFAYPPQLLPALRSSRLHSRNPPTNHRRRAARARPCTR